MTHNRSSTRRNERVTTTSERYAGVLQTFNADGKTSEKRWIFERIGSHGQSKSIIRFTEPPEVQGVALLIVNHPERASDQWMWTPALQRDRRIALQDRSTRFFGTDFSFEDLEERVAAQYEHTLLGEETIDGAADLEDPGDRQRRRGRRSTRKQILWIRKDNYVTVRIDSYVKDEVVRRLQSSKIPEVQGIWTAHEMVMTDLRRGSRTRLALDKVQYNLPLNDCRLHRTGAPPLKRLVSCRRDRRLLVLPVGRAGPLGARFHRGPRPPVSRRAPRTTTRGRSLTRSGVRRGSSSRRPGCNSRLASICGRTRTTRSKHVWRLDWDDRSLLRPRFAVRRLAATVTAKGFTLDVGKQFIRWARADVLNPIDRFAPRDYPERHRYGVSPRDRRAGHAAARS